jgi:hypothetical protein
MVLNKVEVKISNRAIGRVFDTIKFDITVPDLRR